MKLKKNERLIGYNDNGTPIIQELPSATNIALGLVAGVAVGALPYVATEAIGYAQDAFDARANYDYIQTN